MAWKVCVAAAIGLGTVACTDPGAPPLAVSTFSEAAVAPVGRVRYWGEYDEGVSYRPRPRGYGYPLYGYDEGYARRRSGYGPRRYDEPRRYERYNYDREAAKDYVKSYRRAQKDEFKAQVRGWNRAHGF
jgi:hypothetical protein